MEKIKTFSNRRSYFSNTISKTSAFFILAIFCGQSWASDSHKEEDEHEASKKRVESPEDARRHGIDSLRLAIQQDGGVPLPDRLNDFIKDKKAAIQLGKALFWDMQVGSDSVQACASCHFHAGADNRSRNQLNPNLLTFPDLRDGDVIGYFQAPRASDVNFHSREPNGKLKAEDFPLVKSIQNFVTNENGTISPSEYNSNDIVSSMGIMLNVFDGVQPGVAKDLGTPLLDPVWNVGGVTIRRVEPRNTPSVINAVFNFTNFWDGRANPRFNGQSPFGDQDPLSFVIINHPLSGLAIQKISLNNASLASQAVAPLTSFFEMSFGNPSQGNTRSIFEIGFKLLRKSPITDQPLKPLGLQYVHPRDSVLGDLVLRTHHNKYHNHHDEDDEETHSGRKSRNLGLNTNYQIMIEKAFVDQYWNSPVMIPGPNNIAFSHMEANFGLFFGLAVMMYQSTLVADQSPFDQWMEHGKFNKKFGKKELAGLNLFVGQAKCIECHGGPELTNASVRKTNGGETTIRVMDMAAGSAFYDNGFYNISVTPTTDDIGRGDKDAFGKPLAYSRQSLFKRLGLTSIEFTILGDASLPTINEDNGRQVCEDLNSNNICEQNESIISEFQRVAVDGAFKTPGLRNSELTGPYFHNGGMATLRQVVQFYNRGGNFCRLNIHDLDPAIQPLGLSNKQEKQLVSFLVSLTDSRVKYRKAPFDHPSINIPINGLENAKLRTIRAVGNRGSIKALKTFLDLDPKDPIFTPKGTCVR